MDNGVRVSPETHLGERKFVVRKIVVTENM